MLRSNVPGTSLVEVLHRRAQEHPQRVLYQWLVDGEKESGRLTYGELDRRAITLATTLRHLGAQVGERALLLFPPGLEFIEAFFGCLYAGVVAVPSYPPRPRREPTGLKAIVRDAEPSFVLTTAALLERSEPWRQEIPHLAAAHWVAVDSLEAAEPETWQGPEIDGQGLAFLQYTSGSTSLPKGVMVRHSNLIANEEMIHRAFETSEESVMVGWLPLYHDMGLIGNVLQPLYIGARCVLMSPMSFLQRPKRWLAAISQHRATVSGGPNFAYELCLSRIKPEERQQFDLSTWRVAFNGAEPVRAVTMDRFREAFAGCGFQPQAFYPCYGLAEATLLVSGGDPNQPPIIGEFEAKALEEGRVLVGDEGSGRAFRLASSGNPARGVEVLICDPETGSPQAEDRVGEIWVAGAGVAGGYLNLPEASAETFGAQAQEGGTKYLRTGDLGFLRRDELFVTGRIKDLLIIRGRNHYPQDLELVAENSHPALRTSSAAAFSVDVSAESGGEERVVVVAELERRRESEAADAAGAIRQAIAEQEEIQVDEVVLLRAGWMPKTTSGKVQRRACRDALEAQRLPVIYRSETSAPAVGEEQPPTPEERFDRQLLAALPRAEQKAALEVFLAGVVARQLRLPLPEVDLKTPVTRLGLDSLGAVEISHELSTALEVDLPLARLLEGSSLDELANDILARLGRGAETVWPPLERAAELGGERPLSRGQRALWFLERLAPESGLYNLALALRTEEALDVAALRRACIALVRQHEMLRAGFFMRDGEPWQRIHAQPEVDFSVLETGELDESGERQVLAREAYRPFDLDHGPLLRVCVWPRPGGGSLLLLAVHHLVCDFWSMTRLVEHLGIVYAPGGARVPSLPSNAELPRYGDYVRWQETLLASHRGEELWDYWRSRLVDEPWALELPTDRPRGRRPRFRGRSLAKIMRGELIQAVEALARARGTTLFTLLLAAYQVLLHRQSGHQRFLVGSPTLGRAQPELRDVVGYFVNPLPLRANFEGSPSFEAVLEDVRKTVLRAFEHQDFPFALMVERLEPEREAGRSPLFQAMFVLQKAQRPQQRDLGAAALDLAGSPVHFGEVKLETLRLGERRTPFDLTLTMAGLENGERGSFGVCLEADAELFDESTTARMLGHFEVLLEGLVQDPSRSVHRLPMLRTGERWQLLGEWHAAAPDAGDVPLLHRFFSEQVERTPHAIAVDWNGEVLSYGDLALRSDELARRLRAFGVGPEVRVGVCLERSARLLVALLGVLKAGGAYVPLDPAYPFERLAFMLEDSSASVLVTEDACLQKLGDGWRPEGCELWSFDGLPAAVFEVTESKTKAVEVDVENLAYVIYTSGSTGRPKGVAIRHRNAAWMVSWARWAFSRQELDGVLAATSVCFDLSIFELFVPLAVGGRVIGSANVLEMPRLPSRHLVSLINTVPSAMSELLGLGPLPAAVQVVNLAGEVLPRPLVDRIYQACPGGRVFNLYGPSEDTTYSTWGLAEEGVAKAPNIGRPVSGTSSYVLDSGFDLVPVGIPGDLYLGGESLARGYLGRPALTAERFVPNPFSGSGRRLYHTGDLVRWSRWGTLNFLGRVDHQVKLRGFRIELGEVEAVLLEQPVVQEAAVGVAAAADQGLAAFVVLHEGEELDAAELRRALEERLPPHMVTTHFVELEALPRLPNGKVDRSALAQLDVSAQDLRPSETPFLAPRTPVEEVLAGLWQEILEVPEIGIHDRFFELGGHSLAAIRLIAHTREALGIDIPLQDLFERPTIADMAHRIEELRMLEQGSKLPPLNPRVRSAEDPLPLSFAQERLWFLHRLAPLDPAYNMAGALRFVGDLDPVLLGRCLHALVLRHEPLRTSFREGEEGPEQVILGPAEAAEHGVDLLLDLSHLAAERRWEELRRWGAWESLRPFDLERQPPVRFILVRMADEESVLLLTLHHIAGDGWSLELLSNELVVLYEAYSAGQPSPLESLEIDYADFATWQRQWLQGEVLAGQMAWWCEHLADLPHRLELPTDRPRPKVRGSAAGRRSLALPAELASAVKAFGRDTQATHFMVLTAAFQALLYRLSGGHVIPLGTPVAGRPMVEVEALVGVFVNTLVLRGDVSRNPSFRRLVERTRRDSLSAYTHQDLPFERLVEELAPERDTSQTPLFQILIAHETVPQEVRRLPGLEMSPLRLDAPLTKFDLALSLADVGEGMVATLTWSRELFDDTSAWRLQEQFSRLLQDAMGDPEQAVSALSFLAPAERHQVLCEWTPQLAAAPQSGLIHQLFKERAAASSQAVAVVAAGGALTFGELDRRSNDLAKRLRAGGIGPEMPVGLLLERSLDLMVGVFGILKAGAAYLPMSPEDPPARLELLLSDSGAEVVVTRRDLAAKLGEGNREVIFLDALGQGAAESASAGQEVRPQNAAYMLYTSGSTGRPKGVMVSHLSVMSLVEQLSATVYGDVVNHGAGLRVAMNAPLAFDASVKQWAQLLCGHTVLIVPEETRRDGTLLLPWLTRARLDSFDCTPGQLKMLLLPDLLELPAGLAPGRILVGGEAVEAALWQRLGEQSKIRFWNVYGPTESTVDATVRAIVPGEKPSLGYPLADTGLVIMCPNLRPVPRGAVGEICLSGIGLARGYAGQPALTAEKFVPHPISGVAGERLYRTGDGGRHLADGRVEYLERLDNQVKVRGFRLELGEIEAVLVRHPAVQEAAVVALAEDGAAEARRLVAYVVGGEEETPVADLLRDHLSRALPSHMVPQTFVNLEALPLTRNGKVDYRALPIPERDDLGSDHFVAPRSPLEQGLAELWSELLDLPVVGIHAHFFELGGHSLLAARLVARIRQSLAVEVELRELFEYPTVAELARRIGERRLAEQGSEMPALVGTDSSQEAPSAPGEGALRLSFAQERLWFLHRLQPLDPSYNMPGALRIEGTLQVAALAQTLEALVERHEPLRTTYREVDGQPVQRGEAAGALVLPLVDLGGLAATERKHLLQRLGGEESRRPFDLERQIPFRFTLLRLAEEEHVLLFTFHHIAGDGWSFGVLVEELETLYSALAGGASGAHGVAPLPPLPVRYVDFASWQRRWLSGAVLEEELAWWRNELAGLPARLELPTDRPRPVVRGADGGRRTLHLPAPLVDRLKQLGQESRATLFMVLTAAFQAVLGRLASASAVPLGTPVAGRPLVELEGLVGVFVNTLVLRGDLTGDPTFRTLLERARNTALDAYAHQDLPFERLVEELAPRRDTSQTPIFQVMIVQGNAPREARQLPGCTMQPLSLSSSTTKFDLDLAVSEVDGGIDGLLTWSRELFDETTMRRLLRRFELLLRAALEAPEARLSDLPHLAAAERHQLLWEWNPQEPKAASSELLHGLFQAQAARTPQAVAVRWGGDVVSYGDLARQAATLAQRLVGLGGGPEVRVGVCLERSSRLLAALLGILEAGGTYVPLDPAYPQARLQFMLEDSAATVLVSEEGCLQKLGEGLSDLDCRLLNLDDPQGPETVTSSEGGLAHRPQVTAENLAYVIYTSGSTGRPKGVAIRHRNATTMVRWALQAFHHAELAGVLASTSVCFDLSIFELFTPLAMGGQVVGASNILALPTLAERDEVTLINTVPSAMAELLGLAPLPPSVRVVNLAGEVLPRPLVEEIDRAQEGVRVLNLYGPSEDTTYSTEEIVAVGVPEAPAIGRAVRGSRAYVLDRHFAPVAVGVPGELYLGGSKLAREYLERRALTAERFVPDPFGGSETGDSAAGGGGGRLYRTGDLVRWSREGVLDFLGRIDHQVKLRGFRIELGEVEAALLAQSAIAEVAVTVPVGAQQLVAFVVLAEGQAFESEAWRQELKAQLLQHMVPSRFVELPSLPRLPNGKVDRSTLARHSLAPVEMDQSPFLAPRTPTEEVLADLWCDLLAVPRVGVHDRFFELGGHSLLATRLVAQVRQALTVEVPLKEVFEHPTLGDLARRVDELQGHRAVLPPIERLAADEDDLPLSYAQERLWFLHQLAPEDASYNMPGALRVEGKLYFDALRRSLQVLVERHEPLRTTFEEVAGAPALKVQPVDSIRLAVVDLGGLPTPRRELLLHRLGGEESRRPFDLSREPIRFKLLRLGEEDHVLLFTFHHIAGDGWSFGVLVEELETLYGTFLNGEPSPLPPLQLRYAEYAAWQRRRLEGEIFREQLNWWSEELAGLPGRLELPTDRPRPPVRGSQGAQHTLRLTASLVERLKNLGQESRATLFMVMTAAFQTVLGRLANAQTVPLGTPVAGRPLAELDGLVGVFVNTLVLRGNLSGDPTFRDLLERSRESALAAYAHQDLPFERLVEELAPQRDTSQTPLFQVMIVHGNVPRESRHLPECTLSPLLLSTATTKFDLDLAVSEVAGGLDGILTWSRELFDETTMHRLLGRFELLLSTVLARPDDALSTVSLLDASERQQLLREWNPEVPQASSDDLLHVLFKGQAARTPEAVAVRWGEEELRYQELAEQARSLAARLRNYGVGPEVRVGVCLERSARMVTTLLGILEAGGAYVPLDPAYPQARLQFMLEDSASSVLVTEEQCLEKLGEALNSSPCHVLNLDLEGRAEDPVPGAGASSWGALRPENLAYVIYTSGSTGRPKGVAIHHRNAAVMVKWAQQAFSRQELRGVLASTSVCFDLSIFELFVPLSMGGQVIGADNVLALPTLPARHEVSLVNTVPSAMAELLGLAPLPPSVRVVNLAGEALPRPLVDQIYRAQDDVRVLNLYGPSEDTTYSTEEVVAGGEATAPAIGRAVQGSQAYVLDQRLEPVPTGVPGELYLGGSKVARGYLERPALTAERFLPDHLSTSQGEGEDCPAVGVSHGGRLYRTGDLVRWTRDGVLDFLGRIDHQVKLRGFRIELGEVEAALLEVPAVQEAAVAVPAGEQRLVAFVVVAEGEEVQFSAWRDSLLARLPRHMVPSHFVKLPGLPRLPNGKVDRGTLARFELAPEELGERAPFVAPRTPTEEVLADLWRELLKVSRVGVHDQFFALGGHSLLATRLVSRIRQVLEAEVPLREIFEHPSLEALAREVESKRRGEGAAAIPPIVPQGLEEAPLSFAQERLWFLEQLDPDTAGYALPAAFRVVGDPQISALRAALTALVDRQGSLRTTFQTASGKPFQQVASTSRVQLKEVDLRGLPPRHREEESARLVRADALRPFDLTRGPLLRFTLLRLEAGEQVLLFNLHHLVGDAWSIDLFLRELSQLYAAARHGQPAELPRLAVQYADYSAWQRQALSEDLFAEQLDWWRGQLHGLEALELPTDRPRRVSGATAGGSVARRLPDRVAAALEDLQRSSGSTSFMVLLAAFMALLQRYAGKEDVAVGTPIAHRGRAEVEGLIGFFVNTLVLRGRPRGELSFDEFLAEVRAAALGGYDHQDLPFAHLVDALQPERSLERSPLFQVMFAVEADTRMPDLGGLELIPLPWVQLPAKFELMPTFTTGNDSLTLRLGYNRALFDHATVQRMLLHFERLLEASLADPQRSLEALPLLTAPELHQLQAEWGEGAQATEAGLPLVHRVAAKAASQPQALAVICGEERMTYGQLEARAQELARRLVSMGVEPGAAVGLYLERSSELLAATLGIWKAGAIFVPLDPAYPAARLKLQMEDSQLAVLITTSALNEGLEQELKALNPQRLLLDLPSEIVESTLPESSPQGTDAAYLIYTSGTTGRPKAVVVEHRQLAHTLENSLKRFDFRAEDTMLYSASFAFDISFFEWLTPILAGGTVRMLRRHEVLDPSLLAEHLQQATMVHGVPGLMATVVDVLRRSGQQCRGLRRVFVGGEAVPPDLLEELVEFFPGAEVHVLYGPTEATIICASFAAGEAAQGVITGHNMIGRPLPGVTLRLFDQHRRPVPTGVPGELYIGGAGITRGYLGLIDLTTSSYPQVDGQRMYRTGDLARWLPSGDLEFQGRVDHQIKIRGHRVELREIEAVLGLHEGVRRPVAVAHGGQGGEVRLVVFFEVDAIEEGPSAEELTDFLRQQFPAHMVPAVFLPLLELPRLPTGKIDRTALSRHPLPSDEVKGAVDDTPPSTEVEGILTRIFAEVLGLEREVGVNESFFALGGDSILSIQVLARAREVGVSLTPRQIFEHPSAAMLAQVAGTVAVAVAEQGMVSGPLTMSPVQHHFFTHFQEDLHHFNMSLLLALRRPLDEVLLGRTFEHLVGHHDALRSRFVEKNGAYEASCLGLEAATSEVARIDLSALSQDRRQAALRHAGGSLQASLGLEGGPLFRWALFSGVASGEPGRLLMVAHHLVIDGVSWRVLLADLETVYRQLEGGEEVRLPAKTTSFKSFTEQLQEEAQRAERKAEIDYWRQSSEVSPLKVDFSDGQPTFSSLVRTSSHLDQEQTQALLQEVPPVYNTGPEDALLTALVEACRILGGGGLRLDLEGHGREIFEGVDVSRTVGWFTAVYPVYLELPEGGDLGTALKATKEQLRAVPGKGEGFGVLRYLSDDEEVRKTLATLPAPEVSFTYLGQLDLALASDSLLVPLQEEAGDRSVKNDAAGLGRSPRQVQPYRLDVVARISGGRLEVSWTYSERLFKDSTIERLAKDFNNALLELIDHCRNAEEPGFTASDFELSGLEEDDILAALDEIEL